MKRSWIVIAALGSLSAVGCGKSPQGTYVGTETITRSQGDQTYPAQASQVTITLNEPSGEFITGSWNSSINGSFNFQGRLTAEQIDNIVMVQTSAAQTNTVMSYSGCVFGGALNLGTDRLDGTLSAPTVANSASICGSLSITAVR